MLQNPIFMFNTTDQNDPVLLSEIRSELKAFSTANFFSYKTQYKAQKTRENFSRMIIKNDIFLHKLHQIVSQDKRTRVLFLNGDKGSSSPGKYAKDAYEK